jgi:nickel transport protein
MCLDPIRFSSPLRSLIICSAALAAILVTSATALCHGLSVFAWVEGQRVMVESKFSGGKRPVNATVRVLAPDGRELLTGKTDDQGRWAFDLPQKTALKIVLEAGTGHRAEWALRAEEVGAATIATNPPAPPAQEQASPPAAAGAAAPAAADLEARFAQLVAQALQPINARLAHIENERQGPSLQDILGGLGYILGLVGIGAYVQARRIRDGRSAPPGQTP